MAPQDTLVLSLVRLICLTALLFPALAQANAGQLIFTRGDVSITGTDGQARAGRIGAAVREGDHVTTGADSMVQIRLSDGALVSLRSHSDYQIQVQKEEGLLEQAGKLFSGWMRAVSGSIGESEPDNVSWSTPVATIGIRGTTFQVIHVPEGGLPGYDDTPPGTYIYLEEGGIESSSEGGSRYIQPGQVVWVADRNQRPRLAPERRKLFSGRGSLASMTDEERREARRQRQRRQQRDADQQDRISDALLSEFLAGNRKAALGIYGSFGFPEQVRSIDPNIQTAGSGITTVITGMRMPGTPDAPEPEPEFRIFANPGATPVPGSVGGTFVDSESLISWGAWGQGDYTVTRDYFDGSGPQEELNLTGNWSYIWTNNPVFDAPGLPAGISGKFTYDYAGGTTLTGPSSTIDITGGRLVVEFSDMELFADLKTFDNGLGAPSAFYGNGSIADFYTNGIYLEEAGDGGFGFGSIQGIFAGETLGGAATSISLEYGSTDIYFGVAAFKRSGVYDYDRVAAVSAFGEPPVAMVSGNTQYLGFGSDRRLIGQLDLTTPPLNDVELRVTDELALTDTGFYSFDDGTEINWGVWTAGNYEVTEIEPDGTRLTPAEPAADWHYMMANNAIFDQNELLSKGPSGTTETYTYFGGTDLTSPTSAQSYFVTAGSMDVTFNPSDVQIQLNSLDLSGPQTLTLSSNQVPVTDFFGPGIQLIGGSGANDLMKGVFVGDSAQGIISEIQFNDGANEYGGVTAFKNASAPIPQN